MPAPLSIGAPAVRRQSIELQAVDLEISPSSAATTSKVSLPISVLQREGPCASMAIAAPLWRATVEQLAGARIAAAAAQLRIIFQKMRRNMATFAQVDECRGIVGQDSHNVGPSRTGPMPLPIGWRPSVVMTSTAIPK